MLFLKNSIILSKHNKRSLAFLPSSFFIGFALFLIYVIFHYVIFSPFGYILSLRIFRIQSEIWEVKIMKKLKFCNSNLSRSYLGNFVTKIGNYEQAKNLILCDNRKIDCYCSRVVKKEKIVFFTVDPSALRAPPLSGEALGFLIWWIY